MGFKILPFLSFVIKYYIKNNNNYICVSFINVSNKINIKKNTKQKKQRKKNSKYFYAEILLSI